FRSLKEKEVRSIHQNIKKILKEAIRRRGSSVENYLDACGQKGSYAKQHKVYQKQGEKCPNCRTIIKRIKISGRSAHYCPKCQPKRS
ncbi:MAG: formamidopyrimidine-DNA glycosylase, partial [Candidatus Portnoybacteria bacterium]|nr:formamidopyrimidine-DNA glycosylase [Candidatus Portnoybacteria bacterium]